jgi:hypothetical protein
MAQAKGKESQVKVLAKNKENVGLVVEECNYKYKL